jgi:helicase
VIVPQVIRIEDQKTLVETKLFPYAKWEHAKFNPIQSRLIETFDGNTNITIASQTNTGKTVSGEMYMSYEMRKRGGKAIYIAPMKALAFQKQGDWKKPTHHFHDLNTSICTGDFRMTQSRVKELDNADLIVMTPEMLASRCRNQNSEKSNFLKSVGTIVFDEAHLLTVPDRGDHIEVALMKMTEINPDVRIVLLSATMPNVDEICGWVTKLTGRDTYFLESEFRGVPLHIHYESYYDGNKKYDDNEREKVASAVGIVNYYSDDKFLVFVHTIRTGDIVMDALKRFNIEGAFHNSKVPLNKRTEIEERFMTDPKLRVVVATSTLAWGLNLPARRVVLVGIDCGLQRMANYNIRQEIGRAGRLGLDDRGDAYILVPESKKKEVVKDLQKVEPIKSTLLEDVGGHHKTLAFHVVSEIHYGSVTTREGFHTWFSRSLAHHQDQDFDDKVVDKVIDLLVKCKAITHENGEYKVTPVGMIASLFYYSPFDVADLKKNFTNLFSKNLEVNDVALAVAMANVDSHRYGICNKQEKAEMTLFQTKVEKLFGVGIVTEAACKTAFAYHNLLNGVESPVFGALQATLRFDSERALEVVGAIDSMSMKWGQADFFKTFKLRLSYGVKAELVELCQLPHIGKARSEKLFRAKIKTVDDVCGMTAERLSVISGISLDKAKEAHAKARSMKLMAMM